MRIIVPLLFLLLAFPALGQLNYTECSNGLQNPALEGGRTELEFADVNNDGNIDILSIGDHGSPYINTQEHGVMVWFGDGRGNWNVYQYGNFGYGGIAVGDVNGDGLLDVGYGMHHNYSGEDLGNDMLEVALGDGTGRMWTAWDDGLMPGGACWGMFSTDFADVDHDGDLDVGSCSFGYGVGLRVYLNQGNGTWQLSWGTPDSINCDMEFYFRDVNRDGNPDIIAATAGPAVYFGDGTGRFYPGDSGLPRSNYGLAGISPGDVDNDGGFDVAFCNSAGGVEVWVYDDSAGRWLPFKNGLPVSGSYGGTQLCDMNADGFCDLVAVGGGHLTVWTGDGRGNWVQAADITTNTPGTYRAMRTGADFDHNGKPDIAIIINEGSWPNYRNWAHAYNEASPRDSLNLYPVFPRGGERFWNGSVQFVEWWSAAPGAESSRIRLELSVNGVNGPWIVIADSLKNNGRYQWHVPETVSSRYCHIRYTVYQGVQASSAITPNPFFIGNPTVLNEGAGEVHPRPLRLTPNPATSQVILDFGAPVASKQQIKLFDVQGRLITKFEVGFGTRTKTVALDRYPAGTYFVVLENGRGHRLIIYNK